MKSFVRVSLILALVMIIAAPLAAQEEKKKKRQQRRDRRQQQQVFRQLHNKLKQVELTEEQQKQIKALLAEHAPKLRELNKKRNAVLTPEIRKARNAARKKASAEGKKGKELQAAIAAAVELGQEQQEALTAVQKELRQLNGKVNRGVAALLTEEQREKTKLRLGRRAGKKAGAAKAKGEKRKKKSEKKKDGDA